ncbi:hypothetical protein CKAH01_12233 [Colletotrichum kahawae]|uniref:Uncharacterized protein n=1 Tax=Colletotrichum kahawae TaxID=34407 RepID=A0AAD9YU59_COLKA|nr:hypothetical protein CKAH01_12233 [Colletotrichum kahawae]
MWLAWIAPGDTFRVGFDLRSWWSLQQSLAQLSTFEKQTLGAVHEVQLSNLKWMKSLYGEIGNEGVERFLEVFPNLQRLLVGIPRTREFIFEDYTNDDLFPLARDSFADQTAIPPMLDIIWAAGVKILAYNASDLAIFETV